MAVAGRNLALFSVAFALLTVIFHFTLARRHFVLCANLLAATLLIGIGRIALHCTRIR